MALWQPTRRELIASAPLLLGAAALPRPVAAAVAKPAAGRNLKLFVLGDWGRDGSHYQRHVARLMDYHARHFGCDAVVTTGDNFYTFGVASARDPQWRTSYEDIYSPALRARPWFPIAGNHDWGGSLWAQLDRTGRDGGGTGGWHMPWLWYDMPGRRFGRPDLHFFFIDTTLWRGRENKVYRNCGQSLRDEDVVQQKKWLADALRASCAPTKIVFGHHPIYLASTKSYMPDLNALMVEASVTAYVFGHKHCLYHVRDARLDHICSGGGSEERVEYRGPPPLDCATDGSCPTPRLERYLERAGFAIFDIGPDALSFRFVDRDGIVTPPETVRSRGNHSLGCSGALPVPAEVQRERARASARTALPCASLF